MSVPQPSDPPTPIAPPEPATPAVPAEPVVPADPTPDRETPPPNDPGYSHRRLERVAPRHAYAGQSGPAFRSWRQAAHQAFVEVLGYAPRPFGGRVLHTEHTDYPSFTRDSRSAPRESNSAAE